MSLENNLEIAQKIVARFEEIEQLMDQFTIHETINDVDQKDARQFMKLWSKISTKNEDMANVIEDYTMKL